jgi:putative transposase
MSRFQKLSPVIWFSQYHIVFVPKYRYRILKGDVGNASSKQRYHHAAAVQLLASLEPILL